MKAKKILTGNYAFTQLGFSLMVTRLKGVYKRDSSELTLQKCTNEMNQFFVKFKDIMASDFAAISKI